MEISNFIVVEDELRHLKKSQGVYSHTVDGSVYFPIEVSIPIIVKGVGCVGIGSISEIRVRKSSTTIFFTSYNITNEQADAYYALYQNQVSTSDSNDPYGDTDVIIPGMAGKINHRKNLQDENSYRNRRDSSSLSDYIDDHYHW